MYVKKLYIVLKKCCSGYDFRKSCIYLAWMEMFVIYLMCVILFTDPMITKFIDNIFIKKLFLTIIAEQIIKGMACMSLIVGTTTKNHILLQPWIALEYFEVMSGSLLIVALCVYAFMFKPFLFLLIPLVILIGIKIYYIQCIVALHNKYKSRRDRQDYRLRNVQRIVEHMQNQDYYTIV